jgi:arylsulfatase A-like enzyme
LQPGNALLFGCLALALGTGSLAEMGRQRALRTVILERAALSAPLLRATRHAEPPARVAADAANEPAAVALPDGPHLGAVDVFLISVDAMRADRLTARTAPTLSALASTGVVFERAYAQVPHTSFSIATLLTGKYVYALSALGLGAASHQTLPQIMKRERFKTAGFYPPSVFTIDRERLRAMEEAAYGFEYVKYEYLDAARRTDQVIHFLESEHPERAFVWVHYFEPHEPYEPHPGHFDWAQESIDRYDGEIHYVDGEVGRLLAYLKKTRPHALVILAADHGEEFGEHGGRYHGTTLYDEQLHVPLAFATLDGGGLGAHRVDAPVGLVDVAPTILALIGITPSLRMRGRDLGPWLDTTSPPPVGAHGAVFAEINQQKAVIDGTHKLVCDLGSDVCSAFDLAADPGERKNRIEEPFAASLRRRLDGWIAEESRFETSGDGDGKTRKILERARLGDKTVAHELPPLLEDPALNAEVARLLATLPPDPANRAAALHGGDPLSEEWVHLAYARLGSDVHTAHVRQALPKLCAEGGVAELCARAALTIGDVPSMAAALEMRTLDEPLQLELIHALGRSKDPRAYDPLLLALGQVRTRAETVAALADLDDPRALPTLLLWLPNEPYVPARARMASLVAQLGRATPDDARKVLAGLAAVEREAPVMAALLPALRAVGATDVVDLARGPARTIAGGELWIVGRGTGRLDAGGTRTTMTDGVARVTTPHAVTVPVRLVDGDAAPRFAFSRPTP